MNSMQMMHNKRNNPIAFLMKTLHHGQISYFHRQREEKAKLSLPWDTTNFEPKLLIKSTHSLLPGELSGITSLSKTFNQDFSHSIVRARPARRKLDARTGARPASMLIKNRVRNFLRELPHCMAFQIANHCFLILANLCEGVS